MTPQEAQTMIVAKAIKDPTFREALKRNPVAAIERELGVKAPVGMEVKVLEDTTNTIHLVLPPDDSARELSTSELEMVAGGVTAGSYSSIHCIGPTEINLSNTSGY